MNGVEVLVNALIRAMGLNKDDLQKQAGEAWETYQGFARDIRAIAATQAALMARFEALEAQLTAWRRERPELRDLALPDDALVARLGTAGDELASAMLGAERPNG